MGTVYVDSTVGDDLRRERLFAGELFVFSPGANSAALCSHARDMAQEAFAPHDPSVAQDSMTPEDYATILADLKPRFIHHPRAKELIPGMLSDLGCDLERTYFDVPRLRTMAHGEFMKVGLALQFHPHRDTWFSAPYAQLNWWLPVYEIESDNSMAFHPRYFDEPIENSSSIYDYDDWTQTGRQQAAQQVKEETRRQPERARGPRARPAGPRRYAGRRGPGVLRRSAPLDGPEHDRADAVQHRLPHRQPRRPARATGRQPTSTRPARARRSATSSARATSSRCRRRSSSGTA